MSLKGYLFSLAFRTAVLAVLLWLIWEGSRIALLVILVLVDVAIELLALTSPSYIPRLRK